MKKSKGNRTAYDAALNLLRYRAQSEAELRKKLKDREYTEEEIDPAIEKLKHYGYVDDEVMADDLFESLAGRGEYGDRYIQQKMKQKGLVCDRHMSDEDEKEAAKRLLEKKMAVRPGVLPSYQRAAGLLARRGFSFSVISSVLGEFDFEQKRSTWGRKKKED